MVNLFDKNHWLNLVLGLFGFYFFYGIASLVIGNYGSELVSTTTHLSAHYYWLVTFMIAWVLSLTLVIIFCKPRSPLFTAVAALLGGIMVLYASLWNTIINLDHYFHKEGLAACKYLIPHLVVLLSTGFAYLVAVLSNKSSKSS